MLLHCKKNSDPFRTRRLIFERPIDVMGGEDDPSTAESVRGQTRRELDALRKSGSHPTPVAPHIPEAPQHKFIDPGPQVKTDNWREKFPNLKPLIAKLDQIKRAKFDNLDPAKRDPVAMAKYGPMLSNSDRFSIERVMMYRAITEGWDEATLLKQFEKTMNYYRDQCSTALSPAQKARNAYEWTKGLIDDYTHGSTVPNPALAKRREQLIDRSDSINKLLISSQQLEERIIKCKAWNGTSCSKERNTGTVVGGVRITDGELFGEAYDFMHTEYIPYLAMFHADQALVEDRLFNEEWKEFVNIVQGYLWKCINTGVKEEEKKEDKNKGKEDDKDKGKKEEGTIAKWKRKWEAWKTLTGD